MTIISLILGILASGAFAYDYAKTKSLLALGLLLLTVMLLVQFLTESHPITL